MLLPKPRLNIFRKWIELKVRLGFLEHTLKRRSLEQSLEVLAQAVQPVGNGLQSPRIEKRRRRSAIGHAETSPAEPGPGHQVPVEQAIGGRQRRALPAQVQIRAAH